MIDAPADGGVVHVWTVDTDMPPPVAAAFTGILDVAELARLSAFSDNRRRQAFLAAHGALRTILGAYRAEHPAHIRLRSGQYGKPESSDDEGWTFSLSHSGGVVLLGVTRGRNIGIDIECGRPWRTAAGLATRFFPPSEAALVLDASPENRMGMYLRSWTRKEACVKAAGAFLMPGLRLPTAADGDEVLVVDRTGRLPGPWLVRDLDAPTLYRAAVAMAGATPYRVVHQQFSYAGPGHAPAADSTAVGGPE